LCGEKDRLCNLIAATWPDKRPLLTFADHCDTSPQLFTKVI
jgi:hypothetical protein